MSLAVKSPGSKISFPRACNNDVAKAQRALNRHYQASIVAEDGIFGEKTEALLRKFQRESGLPVTGELDEKTSKALNASPRSKSQAETPRDAAARSYAAQLDAMTRMYHVRGKVIHAANENGKHANNATLEVLNLGAKVGAQNEVSGSFAKAEIVTNHGRDKISLDLYSAELGSGFLNKDGSIGINTAAEAVSVQFALKKSLGSASEVRVAVTEGIGGHASFGLRDKDGDGKVEVCAEVAVEFALGAAIGGCIESP